jgi:hypothetical protein
MAFLELLSGESATIDILLSSVVRLRLDASPVLITAPVTTALPDVMDDDAEEHDASTLGNYATVEDE